MNKLAALTMVALVGLAPAVAAACEGDDSWAAANTPEKLAAPTPPAATKAPGATVARNALPKAAKPANREVKVSSADAKMKVVSSN